MNGPPESPCNNKNDNVDIYGLSMLLMSKGSKVVFGAYVHNIDTFNAMLKGSKGFILYLCL